MSKVGEGELEASIGPPVDDGKTAQRPLLRYEGQHVILERLQPHHAPSFWENIKQDDSLWTYLPSDSPQTLSEFEAYITKYSEMEDPFLYAIILKTRKKDVVGHIALMNFVPSNRVNEIGYVLLSSKLKRSTAATETFYLMMKASFEDLHSRRVEWKTNTFNMASRKAALRLGFTYEGIFRNHMIVKGRSRDSIWFSIVESERPARKKAMEGWLHASNFDEQQQQRRTLQQMLDLYVSS